MSRKLCFSDLCIYVLSSVLASQHEKSIVPGSSSLLQASKVQCLTQTIAPLRWLQNPLSEAVSLWYMFLPPWTSYPQCPKVHALLPVCLEDLSLPSLLVLVQASLLFIVGWLAGTAPCPEAGPLSIPVSNSSVQSGSQHPTGSKGCIFHLLSSLPNARHWSRCFHVAPRTLSSNQATGKVHGQETDLSPSLCKVMAVHKGSTGMGEQLFLLSSAASEGGLQHPQNPF